MKNNRTNAAHIWKQMEDLLVPQLKLPANERVVYSYLLRHSHLEGSRRLSFSMAWLGSGTHISTVTARRIVRHLISLDILRLILRSRAGHVVDVRLPGEICARRANMSHVAKASPPLTGIERADFIKDRRLQGLIHAREGGICFYCLRRINSGTHCLDHVLARANFGTNSYRNLVSVCVECNSEKGQQPADHFLRQMYREGRLSSQELAGRLDALKALAAGKLRPPIPSSQDPLRPKGRKPRRRGGRGRPCPKPDPHKDKSVRHHWAGKRF